MEEDAASAADSMRLSFRRCAACNAIGATHKVGDNIYSCPTLRCRSASSEISASPQSARIPLSIEVSADICGALYAENGFDPRMIADATEWLATADTSGDGVTALVSGLHQRLAELNVERGAPWSHMPFPMDERLYNIAVHFARLYANEALANDISEGTPATREEESRVIERVRSDRTTLGESETSAHAETLWFVFVLFWRSWLACWDWAAYCALSPSDIAALPKAPPDPRTADSRVVANDMRRAMLALRYTVSNAVRYLFNTRNFSKAVISRYLVQGLFSNVTPGAFAVRKQGEQVASSQEVVSVMVSQALIGAAATRHDEAFILAVQDANDGVFDWARGRFNRAVGTVRGLTTRTGYSAFKLADLLYQVYGVNVCDAAIARAAGLAIPSVIQQAETSPRPFEPSELFSTTYRDAWMLVASQPNWRRDFDTIVGSAGTLSKTTDDRLDRIKSYTCAKSNKLSMPVSKWRSLPSQIAIQVSNMGAYFYSVDPKKPRAHTETVKNDIKALVKEANRKMGSEQAALMLMAISPVQRM